MLRLADDRQGRRPPRRHAALQVRRQQDPDDAARTPWSARDLSEFHSGYRAYSVAALRRSTSRPTPTTSTSTPRSSSSCTAPGSASWRSRSRPTTATRSATSTACATAATSLKRTSATTGWRKPGFDAGESAAPSDDVRAQGVRDQLARPDPRVDGRRAPRPRCSTSGVLRWLLGRALRDRATTSSVSTPTAIRGRRGAVSTSSSTHDLDRGLPAERRRPVRRGSCAPTCSSTCASPTSCSPSLRGLLGPTGTVHRRASRTSPTGTRGCASASGRFDYDQRGILDAGHLRFFTDRTFRRLAAQCGFAVSRREAVGHAVRRRLGDRSSRGPVGLRRCESPTGCR